MQKDTHAGGIILVTTTGVVFILDQLVKNWLLASQFSFETPWKWLSVGISANKGIAFSLPFPRAPLIALSVLIVAIAIGWWIKNKEKITWQAIALGLFIGGALGNLADRVVRRAVIDYFNIFNGSFNVADAAIILGILLLAFRRTPKNDTIVT